MDRDNYTVGRNIKGSEKVISFSKMEAFRPCIFWALFFGWTLAENKLVKIQGMEYETKFLKEFKAEMLTYKGIGYTD